MIRIKDNFDVIQTTIPYSNIPYTVHIHKMNSITYTNTNTNTDTGTNIPASLPIINDDMIGEILKFVPASLNICLVSKLFNKLAVSGGKTRATHLCHMRDMDPFWIWSQIPREGDRFYNYYSPRSHEPNVCTEETFKTMRNEVIVSAILQENIEFFETPSVTDYICNESTTTFMEVTAAKYGRISILDWLLNERHSTFILENDEISYTAAYYGHLNVIQWIIERKASWSPYTTWIAILYSNIHIIKYMIEHGASSGWVWHADTIREAPHYCSNEDVMWLLQNGCPWNTYTLGVVARLGKFDLVKTLVQELIDQGETIATCNLDATYMTICSKEMNPHLTTSDIIEMLQWMIVTHGCEWSQGTIHAIVRIGDLPLLRWAIQNGCPIESSNFKYNAIDGAISMNKLDMVKHLYENGCRITDHSVECLQSSNTRDIDLIRFVYSKWMQME